jgi:ParB/RepB/Spo0J family partition protein
MERQQEVLKTSQEIVSLSVEKLYAHPANPNRLGETKFRKLVRHIERTGQYEPIVVRRHPMKKGAYQILNGHHRVRALKHLGRTRADCVVFVADDAQALVYLATLNRLGGRDNVILKARLIETLCKRYNSRELSRSLGDSTRTIEKLAAFAGQQTLPAMKEKPALVPMTFFVSEADHAMLCEAFENAAGDSEGGTRTERRLRALKRMAETFADKASQQVNINRSGLTAGKSSDFPRAFKTTV